MSDYVYWEILRVDESIPKVFLVVTGIDGYTEDYATFELTTPKECLAAVKLYWQVLKSMIVMQSSIYRGIH